MKKCDQRFGGQIKGGRYNNMSKCIECGATEEVETITLCDDDGFCQSTKHEPLCYKCYESNSQMTRVGHFMKLKNGLYFDQSGFGSFKRVRTEGQLKYIFDRDFYELAKCII